MNMSVSSRPWSTVLTLTVLVLASVAPGVPAGSEGSPEVPDTCEDAGAGPGENIPRAATDVERLWYEYDGVKGIIKQKLELCATEEHVQRERFYERLGWLIHWEVGAIDKQEWTLRVWTAGLLGADPTAFNYQLCQGDTPVDDRGKAPDDESVATFEIDNTMPETRFETLLEKTWIEGGRFPAPNESLTFKSTVCGIGLADVYERAPDSGFGESFHPERKEPEGDEDHHGVGLSVLDDRRRTPDGDVVQYRLKLNNSSDEVRNVTMGLTSVPGQGWRSGFFPNQLTLGPWGSATTELTVAIPEGATPGIHHFNATAKVRNDTLAFLGRVDQDLSVDVFPRSYQPSITADSDGRVVYPGWPLNYTLQVRQDGNVPDRIGLEAGGDRPGWVSLSTDAVDLGPTGSRNVTLRVDVPREAEPGWYEHRVTATSDGSGATTATSVITAVRLHVSGGSLPSGLPSGETVPSPAAPLVVILLAAAAITLRGRP